LKHYLIIDMKLIRQNLLSL